MSDNQWQSTIYGILPHPHEPQLLMVPAEGSWSLPQAQVSDRVWFLHLGWASAMMRETLDLPVTALRYLYFATDEEAHRVEGLYVLEGDEKIGGSPLDGRWVSRDQLADLHLAVPEHRPYLAAYLAEVENDLIPDQRPPWMREGWYRPALAWIENRLADLGASLTRPIAQERVWGLSCVLRAATTEGQFFFKAARALPLAANEGKLMAGLAKRFPAYIPAPVAVDDDSRWTLLADFGGQPGWDIPAEKRAEVWRTFASIQVALAGQVDDLLAMGCADRRLETLISQIDPLLADEAALSGLQMDERQRLRAMAPTLKDRCRQLAGYNLPPSLVHGDLYAGNIILKGDDILFFDWTDASLSHPFFEIVDLVTERDAGLQASLRDAYLSQWTDFEPMDRLLDAWRLAAPLSALHTAVMSHHIASHFEPVARASVAWALPRWLRVVLDTLE